MVIDAAGFSKVLKNGKLVRTFGQLQTEGKLLRPPKGFDAQDVHIESIKLRSFFVWREVDLKLNEPDQLVPDLASGLKDTYPLVQWLRSVVVSDQPEEPDQPE
jgi:uncharacterized protein (DUF2461 family)